MLTLKTVPVKRKPPGKIERPSTRKSETVSHTTPADENRSDVIPVYTYKHIFNKLELANACDPHSKIADALAAAGYRVQFCFCLPSGAGRRNHFTGFDRVILSQAQARKMNAPPGRKAARR